mgnify:CR=1
MLVISKPRLRSSVRIVGEDYCFHHLVEPVGYTCSIGGAYLLGCRVDSSYFDEDHWAYT